MGKESKLVEFWTWKLFQVRACVISARKAKHLDATTMFTHSHANNPLSQSESAYDRSYFIIWGVHPLFLAYGCLLLVQIKDPQNLETSWQPQSKNNQTKRAAVIIKVMIPIMRQFLSYRISIKEMQRTIITEMCCVKMVCTVALCNNRRTL